MTSAHSHAFKESSEPWVGDHTSLLCLLLPGQYLRLSKPWNSRRVWPLSILCPWRIHMSSCPVGAGLGCHRPANGRCPFVGVCPWKHVLKPDCLGWSPCPSTQPLGDPSVLGHLAFTRWTMQPWPHGVDVFLAQGRHFLMPFLSHEASWLVQPKGKGRHQREWVVREGAAELGEPTLSSFCLDCHWKQHGTHQPQWEHCAEMSLPGFDISLFFLLLFAPLLLWKYELMMNINEPLTRRTSIGTQGTLGASRLATCLQREKLPSSTSPNFSSLFPPALLFYQ